MIDVKVVNHFGEIAAEAQKQVERVIRKTAFAIEREAKLRAPVETGFLRASIYTVTAGSSRSFARSSLRAAERRQQRTGNLSSQGLFPEVRVSDKYEALVAVGAEYGIFLEYGTLRSAAQPFMTPAVEAVRPAFERDMKRALEGKA